jgi:hypothetical protein
MKLGAFKLRVDGVQLVQLSHHGPAGGERVGGGPRRSGDHHAVGENFRHGVAVDVDVEVDEGGVGAAVDDHLVQHHVVALQVAFERQTLKPAFSLDRL